MSRRRSSWLAAQVIFVIAAGGWAPPRQALDEPRAIRTQLANGTIVTGRMTAWDYDGFEGSFGRQSWTQLRANDAWRLFRSVMNQQSADHWIALGKVMLQIDSGDDESEHAFAQALRLDAAAQPLIDQARAEVQAIRDNAERERQALERQRLRTMDPEGIEWPADPWPEVSEEHRTAAMQAMRDAADSIMRDRALSLQPVETPLALVYSDLPRADAARLALTLEKSYIELAKLLGLPTDVSQAVMPAPAVVFILQDRDRFELLEAGRFNQLVARDRRAVCHCEDDRVFIIACQDQDADAMAAELICQFIHGVMHRVVSPRRLPAWANEGIGWWIAHRLLTDSKSLPSMRQRGLISIRNGGSVAAAMQMNYADESFPGEGRIGDAIGFLIVQLMIREKQREFVQWVRAIKLGKEWIPALREDYGVEPSTFPQTISQFYMVND